MWEHLRAALLIGSVVCFAAALAYRFELHSTGDGESRRHEIGIPGSPWYTKTVWDGPERYGYQSNMTLWSWSLPVAVLGAVLLGVWNMLRSEPEKPAERAPTPTEPRGSP
jgi:hypothetical protein